MAQKAQGVSRKFYFEKNLEGKRGRSQGVCFLRSYGEERYFSVNSIWFKSKRGRIMERGRSNFFSSFGLGRFVKFEWDLEETRQRFGQRRGSRVEWRWFQCILGFSTVSELTCNGVGSRIMGFTAAHEKLWWVSGYWLERNESVMFQKEKANWKKRLHV